jgi:Ser/Thr protein kinase RdoA (MazF antagonist)
MSDFNSLPIERQIELVTGVAKAALEDWGMSGAQPELLKHRENSVFKIVAPGGKRYAMRVHRRGYHSDLQLVSELQWLDSLRAAGVATTETVRCSDGSTFTHAFTPELPEGRQCDLLAWVDGEAIGSIENGVPLDDATLRIVYRQAGEQAAMIHNHGVTWQPPAEFSLLTWDEDAFFGETGAISGRFWDLESLTPEQLELLQTARAICAGAMQAFGKAPDRWGLVHGDFLPENLFWDGTKLRLIDFDDTGFGWHIYDFATAMFPHLGQPGFNTALDAMVEGYRSRRPLPDDHLEMLPILVMARVLSYVGWVHSRGELGKPYEEMAVGIACQLADQLVRGQASG